MRPHRRIRLADILPWSELGRLEKLCLGIAVGAAIVMIVEALS